jgi:cysteine sulfinate desulfinase/cysteine desulfurase-like protein
MSAADARSVIRVSLGSGSTAAEVDAFLVALAAALADLRAGALA